MTGAPVLILAGGTGGHVFPALAVATALRQQNEQVVWLGTRHGLEARVAPAAGFPVEWVRVRGVRRKGLLAWLAAPVQLTLALWDALRIVWRCRPKVVLGMGGYVSGPGGLAAWLLRRPLIIHEQNAVAGLTNRLLALLAREVLIAFPGSFSASRKTRTTGIPVRDAITGLPDPAERLGGHGGPMRLLVIGGSQGAQALNQAVPAALAQLPAAERPAVWHQAGEATLAVARAAYAQAGIKAKIEPFIDDMAAAYAWADLVVARSGALTVAELAAAGLGAILVPYPAAVDDHQTRNGEYLANAGAAVLIPQAALTPERLAAEIAAHVRDPGLRLERARRARALGWPRATADMVRVCLTAGGAA